MNGLTPGGAEGSVLAPHGQKVDADRLFPTPADAPRRRILIGDRKWDARAPGRDESRACVASESIVAREVGPRTSEALTMTGSVRNLQRSAATCSPRTVPRSSRL